MVAFLTRFVAVVLVTTVIVQVAHSEGIDDDMIAECTRMLDSHFLTGKYDGERNFIRSFQKLSNTEIEEYYIEENGETTDQATERIIKLMLNMNYFESLFNTNGMKFRSCSLPKLWCEAKAEKLFDQLSALASIDPLGRNIGSEQHLAEVCEFYVKKISPRLEKAASLAEVMKILYEDFTEDKMKYVNIMGKESRSHRPMLINYHAYYLNKFTKPFYDSYVVLLMQNRNNLTGPYISVPEFCKNEGIHVMKDIRGLGTAPFIDDKTPSET